jgi:hypothetical protein
VILKIANDGRAISILPLTYGRARLVIGPLRGPFYDDGW